MTLTPDRWTRLLPCLALLLAFATDAAAGESPVRATVTLVHTGDTTWRADYRLSEAVEAIELGPKIVEYRATAWHLKTPGLRLASDADGESIRADGKAFDAVTIEIDDYEPWSHDHYIPIDRHSDGGHAFYLGHLMGTVRQAGRERDLRITFELVGRHDENVLLADQANEDKGTYAYFGPQKPIAAGSVRLVLDPKTPAWMRDTFTRTVTPLSSFYQDAFRRNWRAPPLVIISAGALDTPGFSVKGGALPGEIAFRIAGEQSLTPTPELQGLFEQLVAHELAHVWQGLVQRGGIGDGEAPWVHEGGAQALSIAALEGSGLWTAEQARAFRASLGAECARLRDAEANGKDADASRFAYTCGYERIMALPLEPVELWKRLIAQTERTGQPYSAAMVERVARASSPRR